MNSLVRNFRLALVSSVILFTGCAAQVGSTIEAPEIPPIAMADDARARLGSYIAIQEIVDSRQELKDDDTTRVTQPFGGVSGIIKTGLRNAFRDAGISVIDSSPIELRAEVRKWQAEVSAKGTSTLSSEATLYVELIDPSGKKVFTGSYNGTRSSQFPVITRVDVKDSLGLSMANAISQLVADPKLIEMISSY